MVDGAIVDVNRSEAQGTLTDVRPVQSLLAISIFKRFPPLDRSLRPNVRGMEREHPLRLHNCF